MLLLKLNGLPGLEGHGLLVSAGRAQKFSWKADSGCGGVVVSSARVHIQETFLSFLSSEP